MAQWLKESTAVTVKLGPFVDSTDGNTVEDGLTISQADIRLSKNGAAFAQTNNATGATHDAAGWYGVPLDTTDTGTLGTLKVAIHESGALPVWDEFMVVPANVWDSMFGADKLQVDAVEISSDSAAADNLESACDNYSATRGLAGTALPAAAADAAGGLPISDAGGLDLDTYIKRLEAAFTSIIAGRIDEAISTRAPESGGNVAAIKTKTDGLNFTGTDVKATLDGETVSVAEILAAALADLFNTDSGTTYAAAVAGSPVKEIADNAGGGGAADWTVDERKQMRSAMGIDGDKLPAADGDVQAIAAAIAALVGIPSFTVASPVSASGDAIELVQGDDYSDTDARALMWTDNAWPDLTAGTTKLRLERAAGTLEITCSLSGSYPGAQVIKAELTDVQTATLDIGMSEFQLVSTLASANIVTLAYGTLTVINYVPPAA